MLTPGYCFTDDLLTISLDTNLINEMIEAKTSNRNILSHKYFLGSNIPKQTNSVAFLNMDQGILAAKNVALQVVALAGMSPDGGEKIHGIINDHVIPMLDCLGAIKSMASFGIDAGDHSQMIMDIRVEYIVSADAP